MPGPLLAVLAALFLLGPGTLTASAREIPDLKKQRTWTQGEKDTFLKFIESGESRRIQGTVREAAAQAPSPDRPEKPRKPYYLSLEIPIESVLTVPGSGSLGHESTSPGARLLFGRHLFSWVRLYSGFQYSRMRADTVTGTRIGVNHYQVPLGVELALVPLGTPQTRYILMRGGVNLHRFESNAGRSDFQTPLLGWQGSWNVGLGYEWQIAETNWRVHALGEGYGWLVRRKASKFYGAGLSVGIARAF